MLGAPLVLSSILLDQGRTEAVELVPLGNIVSVGGPKKTGLSVEEVKVKNAMHLGLLGKTKP